MKKWLIFATVFIVVFMVSLLPQNIEAKSSSEFIDYLTSIVYKDCTNNNTMSLIINGTVITQERIKEIIMNNDKYISNIVHIGGEDDLPVIFSCQSPDGQKYELKINFYNYLWRDTRMDSATYNMITQIVNDVTNSTVNQVAVQGDNNLVNTGDFINQVSVNLSISISISVSVSLVMYWLFTKRKKKIN